MEKHQQAFPAAWGNPKHGGDYVPGMSLRDYFAASALPQAVEDYGQPDLMKSSGQRRGRGNRLRSEP